MVKLPKLKRNIKGFLIGEEGKISKQALMKIGFFLTTGAIGTSLKARNVAVKSIQSSPSLNSEKAHPVYFSMIYHEGKVKAGHAVSHPPRFLKNAKWEYIDASDGVITLPDPSDPPEYRFFGIIYFF